VSGWRWITSDAARAIHEEQLAEWGGGTGTRDEGGLESALARPLNLAAYGDPDAPALAAAYAFGVCRNPPFVDGNKRTAWVLTRLFLAKNGRQLVFREADASVRMLALAAGELSEEEFAGWLRECIREA
jgi:death-on-curing protein